MGIMVTGKAVDIDEEGYLVDRNDWSEELAEEMSAQQAEKDGLP